MIYTKPWWEKKLSHRIREWHGVETWCPVQKVRRKWSDRIKLIEEPVFRSYVFVRLESREHSKLLSMEGVLSFVRTGNEPSSLKDEDIKEVKKFLEENKYVRVEGIEPGSLVKLTSGVFKDRQAIVTNIEGEKAVLVLNQIGWKLITAVEELSKIH